MKTSQLPSDPAVARRRRAVIPVLRPVGPSLLLLAIAAVGVACEPASMGNFGPLSEFTARIEMPSDTVLPRIRPALAFLLAASDPADGTMRPALYVERFVETDAGVPLLFGSRVLGFLRITSAGGDLHAMADLEHLQLPAFTHDYGTAQLLELNATIDADGTFTASGGPGGSTPGIRFSAWGEITTACAAYGASHLQWILRDEEIEIPIENGTLVIRCDGSGFSVR